MKRPITILLIISILLTTLLFFSCSERDQAGEEANGNTSRELDFTGQVQFLKASGDTVSAIRVAVANDNRSRNEGLMNVTNLSGDAGMLFVFDEEQTRSFWMANTPIPLDILFIDSEMNIVRIHRDTRPYSQESIQSEQPAQFVVEVNAGYTLQLDISEGMKIAIEGVDY